MSRASLGAADCGKRLSIADEEGVVLGSKTDQESATRSALKGREKDGRTNRPRDVISYIIRGDCFLKKYLL